MVEVAQSRDDNASYNVDRRQSLSVLGRCSPTRPGPDLGAGNESNEVFSPAGHRFSGGELDAGELQSDGIFRFEPELGEGPRDSRLGSSRQPLRHDSSASLLEASQHGSFLEGSLGHDELSDLEITTAQQINATVDRSAAIDTSRLGEAVLKMR